MLLLQQYRVVGSGSSDVFSIMPIVWTLLGVVVFLIILSAVLSVFIVPVLNGGASIFTSILGWIVKKFNIPLKVIELEPNDWALLKNRKNNDRIVEIQNDSGFHIFWPWYESLTFSFFGSSLSQGKLTREHIYDLGEVVAEIERYSIKTTARLVVKLTNPLEFYNNYGKIGIPGNLEAKARKAVEDIMKQSTVPIDIMGTQAFEIDMTDVDAKIVAESNTLNDDYPSINIVLAVEQFDYTEQTKQMYTALVEEDVKQTAIAEGISRAALKLEGSIPDEALRAEILKQLGLSIGQGGIGLGILNQGGR